MNRKNYSMKDKDVAEDRRQFHSEKKRVERVRKFQ